MTTPSPTPASRAGSFISNFIGYGFIGLVLLIIFGVAGWTIMQRLAAARSPVQTGRVRQLYHVRRAQREPEYKAVVRHLPAGAADSAEATVTVSAWLYPQLRRHDVLPIQVAPGHAWLAQLAGTEGFERPAAWWLPPALLAAGTLLSRRRPQLAAVLSGGVVLWGLGLFAYTAWLDARYQLYQAGADVPLTLIQLEPPTPGEPARATLRPAGTAATELAALRADEYAYLFVSQHRATPLPLTGRRPWLGGGPVRWEKQLAEIRRAAPGYGPAVFWLLVGGAALYWQRRRPNPGAAANIPAAS
ncbi:hypothetical protein EJV47_10015 [Hymenobacter gummosus]|uniref:Uncharacterized protein n=1 Tax=Hymenobacter gummosus TaxID=1776032 RepID=A0A3S0IPV9_9BACT|nr:hypothetical protein [Hymenobacter gummosus]RTQ50939.1 hypothetical protein EJV47_10015 [Hymenobacter gummosus]